MAKKVTIQATEKISNGVRKERQRNAYRAEFKPHVKPRSRPWTLRPAKKG